jgi:alpha-glucosidase
MKHLLITSLFLLQSICLLATVPIKTVVKSLPNEKWWGSLVALGSQMPFSEDMSRAYDLSRDNLNNQVVPLMLSSEGRYIWSESPFTFQIKGGDVEISSDYEKVQTVQAGVNLQEAYLVAMKKHFPPTGTIPEALFFSRPQYNTWIELMYNQNQADILTYADKVIEHKFPTGVFMVDDNWQKYYGNFEFKPEKFPNPKAMAHELHSKGFKIMLWICPFVSPDSPEYRWLRTKGYLLKDKKTGQPAMITWWNGVSASYDTTNPDAMEHFKTQLRKMQTEYGIDGFKFDAGDVSYMNGGYDFYDKRANVNIFSQKWAELGLDFPYNELRTSWKLGGAPLVQRLGDKDYSWAACKLLIPDMAAAGLLGHLYTCPDLIGGGQFGSFLNIDEGKFDQELIVRSCQLHALMPMMQFSVAPWRILDKKHLEICAHYARLHEEMGAYILDEAKKSSQTGEPMLRHMEYAFPKQGFIDCKDQFMLGDTYLVAPMVTKGTSRTVKLPKGRWIDEKGKKFKGPKTITIDVPLERLPYYKKTH